MVTYQGSVFFLSRWPPHGKALSNNTQNTHYAEQRVVAMVASRRKMAECRVVIANNHKSSFERVNISTQYWNALDIKNRG